MALPSAITCLLLSLLVAVTPLACTCEEERAPMAMASSSLIQCYDRLTNATGNGTESSFRSSLLPLLAALPSDAAPTGFATLTSTGRAFVRGLCFGETTVPSECRGCLSVATRNLTGGCGATTRRAGVWNEHCFAAYADTRASSPAEDAFRSRVLLRGSDGAVRDADADARNDVHDMLVALAQDAALGAAANVSGPRMLATADAASPADSAVWSSVYVLAQCARDRTAAECAKCLQVSARAVDRDLDADRRDGDLAAAVVGFSCYLRFNISTALVPQETSTASPEPVITTEGFVAIVVVVIICAVLLS